MDQFSELLEFVGSIHNINDRQDFFMHVACLTAYCWKVIKVKLSPIKATLRYKKITNLIKKPLKVLAVYSLK